MAKRAKLDHDLVYWGPEDVEALGADDVAAPDDAIKPGKYRWQPAKDGDIGHWVPLEPRQHKVAQDQPLYERALYELVVDAYRREHYAPKYSLDWALWWETTNDAPHKDGKPVCELARLVNLVKGAG